MVQEPSSRPAPAGLGEEVVVTNKVEAVIHRITQAIIDGTVTSGMQLPAERHFAESLGVSRAIVREAYSALEVAGVVERRSGSGSFIANVEDPVLLRSRVSAVVKAGHDPYEVWAAREAIEPALGGMLVANVTREELGVLKRVVASLERSVETQDWAAYFEADQRFHLALVLGTHNTCIAQALEGLICEMTNPLMRKIKEAYVLAAPAAVSSSASVHRRIYESIVKRSAKEYARAMVRHFADLRGIIEYSGD